jgi:hypothetical protein
MIAKMLQEVGYSGFLPWLTLWQSYASFYPHSVLRENGAVENIRSGNYQLPITKIKVYDIYHFH